MATNDNNIRITICAVGSLRDGGAAALLMMIVLLLYYCNGCTDCIEALPMVISRLIDSMPMQCPCFYSAMPCIVVIMSIFIFLWEHRWARGSCCPSFSLLFANGGRKIDTPKSVMP